MQARLFNLFEHRLQAIGVPVEIEFWNGKRVTLGTHPKIKITLRTPAALKILAWPKVGKIAQAYVEGDIDLDCTIRDLVQFAESLCGPQNIDLVQQHSDSWRVGWHSRIFDRRSINYHYDVSNEFYALWLDSQRVYSCAYFRSDADSIDLAQRQKIDHICRKLDIKPGERLLDIGCGWGALMFRATEHYGAHSLGITLSEQQFEYVQQQIHQRHLAERCEVRLLDYRDLREDQAFDKISSVGMFEHVGKKNLPVYFSKIRDLLKPGGLLMNHGLTSAGLYAGGLSRDVTDFIDKYVFPGGEIPHLSKEIELMARSKLECIDVEGLRHHYAKTLWHWVDRLEANQEHARALVGEKKYRIWRIYMAAYALAFQRGWVMVYQVLAGRPADNGSISTPLTREHVYSGLARAQ